MSTRNIKKSQSDEQIKARLMKESRSFTESDMEAWEIKELQGDEQIMAQLMKEYRSLVESDMKKWEIKEIQNDERAIAWLVKDYWSITEGLMLLVGLEMVGKGANPEPVPPFFKGNVGETYAKAVRAVKSESLKSINPSPEEFAVYRPYDFIQFAIHKRVGLWKYWRSLLKANPIPKKSKDWRKRPFQDFEAEKDQYGSFEACATMYGVSRTTYTEYYKSAQLKVGTSRTIRYK